LLMVGFNRRFSPGMTQVLAKLESRKTPLVANYRMNAGFIARDHWVHGPEGGGRNLGEACHIYDLFNALAKSSAVRSIQAAAVGPSGQQWGKNDNFVATISYADGSVCSLTYTALGAKGFPKERMDIFVDGQVIQLDDYKSVTFAGSEAKAWTSPTTEKGQLEELKALADTLLHGKPWPITLTDQLQATEIAFEVERLINLSA
jgi:predicted dehydrogenase